MKTWSSLTRKQAVLYQKLVDDLRRTIENTEGIQRKGIILSSLMKFKQLCNHPDQYLGTGSYDENESGKFDQAARDLRNDPRKTGTRPRLHPVPGDHATRSPNSCEGYSRGTGLVLHGGTPVAKRKEIVARFQDEEYVPFMVLSLKAGGVGLNLTAANHVIHFRPVVEPRCREPGNGPRLQDRPEEERDRPQVHHQGDGRGEDRRDDRGEAEALERADRVRFRDVDHRNEQRRTDGYVLADDLATKKFCSKRMEYFATKAPRHK